MGILGFSLWDLLVEKKTYVENCFMFLRAETFQKIRYEWSGMTVGKGNVELELQENKNWEIIIWKIEKKYNAWKIVDQFMKY